MAKMFIKRENKIKSMFENKSKYLFHLKQEIQYEDMYSLCVGA